MLIARLKKIWIGRILNAPSSFDIPLTICTLVVVIGIGAVDFLLGIELSFQVFYIIPVLLAVVAAGWRFGVVIALLSVAMWVGGDVAAGAHYRNWLILSWNVLIALGTYMIVIWLFTNLLLLQREMEARVRQRTAALNNEIAEREKLEKIILEVSDRERRSIGQDLHDGLGQHLTGTALAAQVLGEQLQEQALPEAKSATKLVQLIEEGIEQTRRLAKGLLLAEVRPELLIQGLQDLAAETTEQFRVPCDFRCDVVAFSSRPGETTHFFRIAQEAVRNAARHARPEAITIQLSEENDDLVLTVSDDGCGLPAANRRGNGLGLSIMAHRAQIAGARFEVLDRKGGGTVIVCRLPLAE